jgi:hypothetical protein
MFDDIREVCGESGVKVAKDLMNLGEDTGLGLIMLGFVASCEAEPDELDMISKVFLYLKKTDRFAYDMLEKTLLKMFRRKSEKAVKEHFGINPKGKGDEDSN